MIINTMTYDDYKKFKNAYNALNLLKKIPFSQEMPKNVK